MLHLLTISKKEMKLDQHICFPMLQNILINDNTSLKFSTRRNKEINLTEYYDLSYEYKNDCLTAALKFKKSFYQDNDLKPTEDLFFTITLVPLATYETGIKR